MHELLYHYGAPGLSGGLALAMAAALESGYRLGGRRASVASEALRNHIGAVQASLHGLLALIMGFTFAVALQHYDARSAAVVNEANALGTSWLRSALLTEPERSQLRALLHRYVESRIIEARSALSDDTSRARELAASKALQAELWQLAAHAATRDHDPVTNGLLLQSLNDSFDAFGTRNAHLARHVPEIVLWILFATFAVAAAVLGYSAGIADHRPPLASLLLIALIVMVTYLIIDLDRPRRGLIQVSQAPLLELQQDMEAPRPARSAAE